MTTKPQTLLPLPDPPEREPEDMTSVQHLGENGNLYHLIQHLGYPDTTIVSGERYIVPEPGTPADQRIAPDMLISFNANPALYRHDNSYVISRQGKPPDLVMEIASRRTGGIDVEDKPARYAALGIPEYWRFDETGEFHGTKLAGDRLAEGRYEPITIEEVEDGVLQGYSAILGLFVRWERGELRWPRPGDGAGNSHLRAGEGSPVGGRGPGPRAGGRTGAEGRRRINGGRLLINSEAPAAVPTNEFLLPSP